jgi:hypothetical protein
MVTLTGVVSYERLAVREGTRKLPRHRVHTVVTLKAWVYVSIVVPPAAIGKLTE